MAKDNDNAKDINGGEDEDLLDFDFDEDLLGEEGEGKKKESEKKEEEIIDLVDVAAEGEGKKKESEKKEESFY